MHIASVALFLAGVAQAHYHFPYLITCSIQQGLGPVETRAAGQEPGQQRLRGRRANEPQTSGATRTAGRRRETGTVAASGTLSIGASQGVFHPRPIRFYMAKAPEGTDISSWDGSGNVWFKTYSEKPPAAKLGETASWASGYKQDFTFTVPKNTPSGDYLVRIEHIALHNTGKPQIYVACGQVTVTNSSSGTPGPLVAFPSAYAANNPRHRLQPDGSG